MKFHIKDTVLIGKYGFDGASGQAQYKQKFSGDVFDESHVFIASFVPLRLVDRQNPNTIFWSNPAPSSPNFCRPIKFTYKKESATLIQEYHSSLKEEITGLQTLSKTLSDNFKIEVHYELYLTMIDGKVSTEISGSGSPRTCQVCGANPKDMNNIDNCRNRAIHENVLKLGLSTLHCQIRTMEFIFHLSYRLSFKQWQARGDNKAIMEERKREIQAQFRKHLGLQIDMPLPG